MDSGAVYAVVAFDGGTQRDVRNVVVPFESVKSADLFAIENGYQDYTVAPMSFFVAHPDGNRASATH